MPRQKSFRNVIVSRLILGTFIPIFLMGILSYFYINQKLTESIYTKNSLLANAYANDISGVLREPLTIMENIIVMYSTHVENDDVTNSLLNAAVQHTLFFESIYILDTHGKLLNIGLSEQLSKKQSDYIGIDLCSLQYFKTVKKTGESVWSDVFLSPVTGNTSLTLSIPFGEKILVGNFSIEHLYERTEKFKAGGEIIASIVDNKGVLIFHPDRDLASQRQNLSNITPVSKALSGELGTYEYGFHGSRFIGSSSRIPETNWIILVSQDYNHAYAPVMQVRFFFLGGLILTVAIVALLTIITSNRLTRPLSHLITSVQSIAGGNYDTPIPAQEHSEIDALASSFGSMAIEIQHRENQIKEKQESYRMLVETMRDGIAVLNEDSRFTYVNPRFTEMVGFSQPELISHDINSFLDNINRGVLANQLIKRRTGASDSYEIAWTKKNGDRLYTIMSPQPMFDQDGNFNGSFAVITDITDRKKIEAERQRLIAILESTSDFVSTSTPDEKITYINKSGLKMLGWSDDISRRMIQDAHPAWALEKVVKEGVPIAIRDGIWVGETALLRGDGTEIPASQAIMSHKSAEGELEYLSTIIRDISERKQTEEELKNYRDHLEELVKVRTSELESAKLRAESADRMKSAFLATMSHEFRTPLNAVIGFTGIILQGMSGPLTDEQEEQLGMVDASARHLLSLINDVLDISKIEAGHIEMASEQFDIAELIGKAVKTVAPLADKQGLQLVSNVPFDINIITGDPRRIEQVILNLLNNAIKFTQKGEVCLECKSGETGLIISISDTGIGIMPEDMHNLFTPFQQIDSSISRRYEGTGLGLSICKKLVELMGGRISVESIWGKGSNFSFTLPVNEKKGNVLNT